MPVYQHKNGNWYLKVQIRGKRYHKAIPEATTRKQAEQYEIRTKSDLLQGKLGLVEAIGLYPVNKCFQEFEKFASENRKGWRYEVYIFNLLSEYFANLQLKDITPFLIEKYRLFRKKQGIKPATINREGDVLSAMLKYAVNQGYINENPYYKVKKLRMNNRVERFLTEEEELKLFMFLEPQVKNIVTVLLHTAMRKTECLELKWHENIDLKKRLITLYETKNGKIRRIPMSNTVYNILKSLQENSHSDYVFIHSETGMPVRCFKRNFKTACRLAKIENLRIHDLRHTAATRMVASGVDLVTVKDILGHSDINTTASRYAHPVPENKKRAVEALDRFVNHKPKLALAQ